MVSRTALPASTEVPRCLPARAFTIVAPARCLELPHRTTWTAGTYTHLVQPCRSLRGQYAPSQSIGPFAYGFDVPERSRFRVDRAGCGCRTRIRIQASRGWAMGKRRCPGGTRHPRGNGLARTPALRRETRGSGLGRCNQRGGHNYDSVLILSIVCTKIPDSTKPGVHPHKHADAAHGRRCRSAFGLIPTTGLQSCG